MVNNLSLSQGAGNPWASTYSTRLITFLVGVMEEAKRLGFKLISPVLAFTDTPAGMLLAAAAGFVLLRSSSDSSR
eukprot:81548-Hanusia_phi.AAC.1